MLYTKIQPQSFLEYTEADSEGFLPYIGRWPSWPCDLEPANKHSLKHFDIPTPIHTDNKAFLYYKLTKESSSQVS